MSAMPATLGMSRRVGRASVLMNGFRDMLVAERQSLDGCNVNACGGRKLLNVPLLWAPQLGCYGCVSSRIRAKPQQMRSPLVVVAQVSYVPGAIVV